MKLLLFLFSCILVLAQIHESKSCYTEERTALLHIKAFLYNQTDHSGHRHAPIADNPLSSWKHDPSSDCCKWNRVKCSSFSGHVTKLYLQDLQIKAFNFNFTIDMSLFQAFEGLRSLNLSKGYFDSMIHAEVLANLNNLEVLSMKANNFEQPLPIQGLCRLKKIRVLDLSANNFQGPLPKCFGNLTSLQGLDLSGNLMNGEIPTSIIASLPSLEYLSLELNDFEGLFRLSSFANNSHLKVLTLGNSWSNFEVETEGEGDARWMPSFQLEVLHMGSCKLNTPRGILPSFLLYQHELQQLDLTNNSLVGQFPNWLLINNTKLKSLKLGDNSFTGSFELRQEWNQHPHSLNHLDLAYNEIAGKLPQDIGHIFPNLEYIYFYYTRLYGTIPTSVGSLSKLIVLDLSNNNLSGEVPKILWTDCLSLRKLILSDNSLSGLLFPSSLNLPKLEYLLLYNNNFSGTVQPGTLPSLKVLDISNNKLWGTIPDFSGNLSHLQAIDLSRNNFTGALMRELCKLDLHYVHLSYNKLSGSIPACYLNSPHLVVLLMRSNRLVGSIPKLSKVDSSLTLLDLRDNNLSGKIPGWVGDKIKNLTALLLAGNHLQGELPHSLCLLEKINFLDLSRNEIKGPIPGCFSNVKFGGYTNKDLDRIYYPQDYLWEPSYSYPHLHMETLSIYFPYEIGTITAQEVEFWTKGSMLTYKGEIIHFMSGLDLSCNQLTGLVPHDMGYLASLHALNLSQNHLNGSIPESFHNLEAIESLDLS